MTANSVLACRGLNKGEEKREKKNEKKKNNNSKLSSSWHKWREVWIHEAVQRCLCQETLVTLLLHHGLQRRKKNITKYKMKMANEGKNIKKNGVSWNQLYDWIGEYILYFSRIYRWLSVFLKWAWKSKSFAVDYISRTAPTFIGGR